MSLMSTPAKKLVLAPHISMVGCSRYEHSPRHLLRETCARRHFAIKTEKTHVYWLGRYGTFLQENRLTAATTEQKMEAFLTRSADEGVSVTTQNQALRGTPAEAWAIICERGKGSSWLFGGAHES